jgi:hypothetical protein
MFYFGLDLGQTTDPTAGIILEAHGAWDDRAYDARYIEQFPLRTSYPAIVRQVSALMDRAPLREQCTLAIDHTGVGRPVFEMFVHGRHQPIGVTITGGAAWSIDPHDRDQWHVSKIQLVGTVQRFLQSGRLRIGATLPHAHTLQKELRDFRVKISKASNEIYESREGTHDDLVLSLAIALFVAEHEGPPPQGIAPDTDPTILEQWRAAHARQEAAQRALTRGRLWGGGVNRRYW